MASTHRTEHAKRKRHGGHQKRTGHFLKVYHPFLPVIAIVVAVSIFGFIGFRNSGQSNQTEQSRPEQATVQPSEQLAAQFEEQSESSVLAYATSVSSSGLLSGTNQRRAAAGVGNLSSNGQLAQAAQAKANDMANRNYWAHNTPEGTPPWAFIANAGYSYSRAGENLACGFNESNEVITGWYNSPTHRDNLLLAAYTDVGFGIANAANYNCGDLAAGQQTIVVAMYGTPYAAPATAPATPAPQPQATATKPAASAAAPASPTAEPVTKHTVLLTVTDTAGKPVVGITVTLHSEPRTAVTDSKGVARFTDVETGKHTATVEIEGAKAETALDLTNAPKEYKLNIIKPVLTSNQISLDGSTKTAAAQPQTLSRLQLFADNNAAWMLVILVTLALLGTAYLVIKHSIAAHRFLIKGEQYVLKHVVVDLAVIALLAALYYLTRNVGAIL